MKSRYSVKSINRTHAEPFVIGIHYAHRWPSITYYFGLFQDDHLVGVCTYGTPPSAPLKKGIAGQKYAKDVLELNRLVLANNQKNEASILIGASLKQLPKNKIVISFADTAQHHVGAVYQATNFRYVGLSAKRTNWKVKGKEGLHGVTIADEFRGKPGGRADNLRAKYGPDFYSEPRPRKHRYLQITGSKSYKKKVVSSLRYKQQPYPKPTVRDCVLAMDCDPCSMCGDPVCPRCKIHYADCACDGPFTLEEYSEVA